MNLILDAGNTFVKIAVFQDNKLLFVESVAYTDFFQNFLKVKKKFPRIDNAILSSVGGLSVLEVKKIKKEIDLLEISSSVNYPFVNKYKTPQTLGKDRYALVSAAMINHVNKNILVIDAGTCITFDFKNNENHYLGGAISPGIEMRYKALNYYTNGLPLLKKEVLGDYIGNSTNSCIHSGIVNGVIQEIDAVISQYISEYEDLTVILTGGDANFLSKQLKSSIFANSNFLLEGLNYVLNYNLEE